MRMVLLSRHVVNGERAARRRPLGSAKEPTPLDPEGGMRGAALGGSFPTTAINHGGGDVEGDKPKGNVVKHLGKLGTHLE